MKPITNATIDSINMLDLPEGSVSRSALIAVGTPTDRGWSEALLSDDRAMAFEMLALTTIAPAAY
jgi:hypothetical protein